GVGEQDQSDDKEPERDRRHDSRQIAPGPGGRRQDLAPRRGRARRTHPEMTTTARRLPARVSACVRNSPRLGTAAEALPRPFLKLPLSPLLTASVCHSERRCCRRNPRGGGPGGGPKG